MDQNAIAKLEGREFEFFMIKKRISIGRNSKEGAVDVNMGSTRFISRKHLEISFEGHKFFLLCRGKNGIFIDDIFQRREAKRMQLPFSCIIRFPSTQIKLVFTSLIEDNGGMMEAHPSSPLPPSSAFQSPYVTPLPSPTGTISVINSCPASPGGGHPLHPPTKIDLLVSADIFRKNARLTSDSEAGDDEQINDDNSQRDHIGSSGSNSPNADNINTDKAIDDHTSNIDTTNSNPDERIGKDGKKYVKPPFSYAQLIVQALLAGSDRKQTLSNIYQFIADKYPFYRLEDKGWKVKACVDTLITGVNELSHV
jgi:forkhead box protein K